MFSIVIPLYNKEKQIAKTLESVFNQLFQEYEIVIVNDGSTDNSVDIVKQIDDKRIKLINQKNGGVSSARNTGIKNASFEYIAFLDADDSWKNNHLSNIYNLVDNYPECSVFVSNYQILDTNNEIRKIVDTNLINLTTKKDKNSGVFSNYFFVASKTAPPLWTSAIVCTKKSIEDIGLFPIGIKQGEDLITWAKLANEYSISYTYEISAIYNYWTLDELIDGLFLPDKIDYVGVELNTLYKKSKNIDLKKYIAQWYKMRMHMYILKNYRLDAFKEMMKLIKYDLRNKKAYLLFFSIFLPMNIRKYLFKKIYKFMKYNKG